MSFKITDKWLNEFGNTIKVRGRNLVFVGKKGRQLQCRLRFLARREKISFKKYIVKAINRWTNSNRSI